ncbi:unnamed protein product, partial [Mesorhabditis spiculigera]
TPQGEWVCGWAGYYNGSHVEWNATVQKLLRTVSGKTLSNLPGYLAISLKDQSWHTDHKATYAAACVGYREVV